MNIEIFEVLNIVSFANTFTPAYQNLTSITPLQESGLNDILIHCYASGLIE